jgi:hypothetical protein
MATCRCTSLKHPEHTDRVCENLATESDGYCKACSDHASREWAKTEPGSRAPANLSQPSVLPTAVQVTQGKVEPPKL